jgi:3-phosphoshikimate 1-carboxyvinyltransferase
MRLLTGLLSGHPFLSILTGDDSIRKRPMARVIQPCSGMGALIYARDNNRYPPIAIRGGDLRPVSYNMPVASAQVKSALILAALYADGTSEITEPGKSRDHTERMLPAFGADISVRDNTISVQGLRDLNARDVEVPGDFSSAAFFLAGALLVKSGEMIIRDCGLNPTRTGFLEIIKRMGGKITTENYRTVSGEPIGDIVCRHSPDLKAVAVGAEEIPLLIDEFPVIALLATQAEGTTEIRGAEELRVKESDRIRAMAENLRIIGARVEEHKDGLTIQGKSPLRGRTVPSFGDHRIAMTMAIAGLIAEGDMGIEGISSVDISFPGFFEDLIRFCR